MAIYLTDSRFDYIKNDSEVIYLKTKLKGRLLSRKPPNFSFFLIERKEHETGVTAQDYIETSDSNFLGYSLTETEMLDVNIFFFIQLFRLIRVQKNTFGKEINFELNVSPDSGKILIFISLSSLVSL